MGIGGGSARSPLSQVHPAKRTEAPSQIRARTLKIVIPRNDVFYTPHRPEATTCLSLLWSSQRGACWPNGEIGKGIRDVPRIPRSPLLADVPVDGILEQIAGLARAYKDDVTAWQ